MKDCFDRDIKEGDVVAYSSDSGGPSLSIARVLGPCKRKGSEQIRVLVLRSNTSAYLIGRRRTRYVGGKRSEEIVRPAGMPYEATIGHPNRVIVINGADLPIPA